MPLRLRANQRRRLIHNFGSSSFQLGFICLIRFSLYFLDFPLISFSRLTALSIVSNDGFREGACVLLLTCYAGGIRDSVLPATQDGPASRRITCYVSTSRVARALPFLNRHPALTTMHYEVRTVPGRDPVPDQISYYHWKAHFRR